MNDYVKRVLRDRMHRPVDRVDTLDYDDGYMDGYADGRGSTRTMGRRPPMSRDEEFDGTDGRRRRGGMDRANSSMYLSKSDMSHWKQMLQNADGTDGPHFTLEKILKAADGHGIKYDKYDEKELCMTANMLYSDFGEALRTFIPPDREILAYVKMADAFLCDDDGPDGPTKLALYYHCIANYE